jgi:molecular chaperone GrpE
MGKKTEPQPSSTDRAEQAPGAALDTPEAVAARLRELEEERDHAVEGRQRALADFQNYQRRALENERRAGQSGAARVVRSILPVLDHFDLTLSHKLDDLTLDQLMGAVKIVRDELFKALQTNAVSRIEPASGDEFDPHLHEAMMRQPAADVPPGHVVAVLQPGYMMDEQVLRPAKVSVAADAESDQGGGAGRSGGVR